MSPSLFFAAFALTLAGATLVASRRNPAPAAPPWVAALTAGLCVAGLVLGDEALRMTGALLAVLGLLAPGLYLLTVRRIAARGEYGRAADRLAAFQRLRRSDALAGWIEAWRATDVVVRAAPDAPDALLPLLAAWEARPERRVQREWLLGIAWRWAQAVDAATPDLRARALCELGRVEAALAATGDRLGRARGPAALARAQVEWLPILAFSGRQAATEAVMRALKLPPALADVWRATALAAAGHPDEARARLDALETRRDLSAGLRYTLGRRRAHLPPPAELGEPARTQLLHLEREVMAGALLRLRSPSLDTPLTLGLLAALAAVFGVQAHLATGPDGTADARVAIELGALLPHHGLPAEPARLLTYAFLHYGALHLIVNAFTIAVVGAPLEAALGRGRLLVLYLGSAVGAGVGISLFGSEDITLGASGAAMGLLGALGTVAARHTTTRGTRTGRQLGLAIAALVALQSVLDALMPEVSFVGHLTGALCGALLALGLVRGAVRGGIHG